MDSKQIEPELSVVIPVYNRGQLIRKTVEMVAARLRGFDHEIVVVNDGSTDNTGRVLNALTRKLRRLRVVEQDNQGVGPARNAGQRAALGRYIWFVDSDDQIPPNALRDFDHSLLHQNLDLLLFNYQTCDPKGQVHDMHPLDRQVYESLPQTDICPADHPDLLYTSHILWNKFWRRSWLERQQIFCAPLRGHEDMIFHLKALCLAKTMRYVPRAILRYMTWAGQNSFEREPRRDALPAFAELDQFVDALAAAGKLPPKLRAACQVFKANHLYWIAHHCPEDMRAEVRTYYDGFLRDIPRDQLLDFIQAPGLRRDVMRHTLVLRKINPGLAEKLLSGQGLLAQFGRRVLFAG